MSSADAQRMSWWEATQREVAMPRSQTKTAKAAAQARPSVRKKRKRDEPAGTEYMGAKEGKQFQQAIDQSLLHGELLRRWGSKEFRDKVLAAEEAKLKKKSARDLLEQLQLALENKMQMDAFWTVVSDFLAQLRRHEPVLESDTEVDEDTD
jgi:hypothetical protein